MSLDIKLNPLATAIIARFLISNSLDLSTEALAADHDADVAMVRASLAPAVAQHILRRDKDSLTGRWSYSAGRNIEQVRDLVFPDQEAPKRDDPIMPPPKRKPLDLSDIQLVDIPVESRRLVGGRYDAIFERALETGHAITLPPEHVHGLSSTARDWLRRRQIKASIKVTTRMPNKDFGCIWIVKGAAK